MVTVCGALAVPASATLQRLQGRSASSRKRSARTGQRAALAHGTQRITVAHAARGVSVLAGSLVVRYPAMSTSGDEFPAWANDLNDTSGWFDRLHTRAVDEFGPRLGIRYKRLQGHQVWRDRCEQTLDELMNDSPIHRLAVGAGDLWYWSYWPKDLTSWLQKQMHNSTKNLWTSKDGATLAILAFGADRSDVMRLATLRLRQVTPPSKRTP